LGFFGGFVLMLASVLLCAAVLLISAADLLIG
jgi:hypothetical protein